MKYSLGVDIGGTKCAVVLGKGELSSDIDGFIIDKITFPTCVSRGWRLVMSEIISQAGRLGSVTISTNMAGRGTDIILGGNAEFMALAYFKKEGWAPELISEMTEYSETDDEEIMNVNEETSTSWKDYKEDGDTSYNEFDELESDVDSSESDVELLIDKCQEYNVSEDKFDNLTVALDYLQRFRKEMEIGRNNCRNAYAK
jgi:hypothetical protein